ncbi:hypothetical protein [Streptomyces sp. NPDC056061]|uniref:deoxynucleotide monophosphate kinase family protein n=1 Tax=Streptomyces sp. NPDC056061 TaxID=3345700 RepID=UPI0035DBF3F6
MNIGIIGRARVGKDTAGAWLVEHRGYQRVAFADPLKEAALKLDPIVVTDDDYYDTPGDHLSTVVDYWDWEFAKDNFPEVRRILQELGAAVRAIDEDFWLRAALAKVAEANEAGKPAVITDVRYPNETESLRRAGFDLVYIHRPDAPRLDHESEGAIQAQEADHIVINDESVADLQREMWLIHDQITRRTRSL